MSGSRSSCIGSLGPGVKVLLVVVGVTVVVRAVALVV
jgi:hypothetical protein